MNQATSSRQRAKDRICLALDMRDENQILQTVDNLGDLVGYVVYWAEIAVANRNIAAHSMDDLTRGNPQAGSTLRRTIVHMIEEYARHCGHADLRDAAVMNRAWQR